MTEVRTRARKGLKAGPTPVSEAVDATPPQQDNTPHLLHTPYQPGIMVTVYYETVDEASFGNVVLWGMAPPRTQEHFEMIMSRFALRNKDVTYTKIEVINVFPLDGERNVQTSLVQTAPVPEVETVEAPAA